MTLHKLEYGTTDFYHIKLNNEVYTIATSAVGTDKQRYEEDIKYMLSSFKIIDK
ncbi:MAG: hypothetical protein HYT07_00885 [Candidatus Levybacteria bacterium]|nr:hypothetical protein [Candidatus Levybacteria bacterium]